MTTENKRAHLISEAHEFVKQYIAYDGSSRAEYIYVAPVDATNGTPCSVTRYVYDGISSRVLKMKEYQSTWNSTWDI
jgi:hypothetical protein